jgi:tetratricopeptide (TPR) repeat protein
MTALCPDDRLRDALDLMSRSDAQGLREVDGLLEDYPLDARLHFVRGSLLAALRDYSAAQSAMNRAVEIAPDYAIARFQAGFLAFTSGNVALASEIWEPLRAHDPEDPLRLFVEGLDRLAVDDFEGSAALLSRGIQANRDNAALNADMRLLLDAMPRPPSDAESEDEPVSLAQFTLRQSAARKKLH